MSRAWLAKVAEAVMEAEGCPPETELSVAIGDDRWIQELNRKYRSKDVPTDVLAFPQEGGPEAGIPLLGDVAISAETAARQAKEQGHELRQEMALLLTHGILHLTGWDDQTPAARRRMMARAKRLLRSALGGCR